MTLEELVAFLVSQHPFAFAGLIIAILFSYAQMRYHEGRLEGLNEGEKICKKHHPEAWTKDAKTQRS